MVRFGRFQFLLVFPVLFLFRFLFHKVGPAVVVVVVAVVVVVISFGPSVSGSCGQVR